MERASATMAPRTAGSLAGWVYPSEGGAVELETEQSTLACSPARRRGGGGSPPAPSSTRWACAPHRPCRRVPDIRRPSISAALRPPSRRSIGVWDG